MSDAMGEKLYFHDLADHMQGEVVHLQRVPGEEEPAYDVGVRFMDSAGAEAHRSSKA
jgi:hypothetical protein